VKIQQLVPGKKIKEERDKITKQFLKRKAVIDGYMKGA